MFKSLLKKEKRKEIQDNIEVVFAVFTILAFAKKQIEKRREAEENVQVVQGHVVDSRIAD